MVWRRLEQAGYESFEVRYLGLEQRLGYAGEGEAVTLEIDLAKPDVVRACAQILVKLGYQVIDVQIAPPPSTIGKITVAKKKA